MHFSVVFKSAIAKRPLLFISSITLLLFLVFYSVATFYPVAKKQSLGVKTQSENQSLPVHLIIPALNVNAAIQSVGVNNKGEMDVPSNTVDVGWFRLGTLPGKPGSAVIDGHFDGENGEATVFADLYKLKKGDKLYIKDNKGASTTFIVRESRTYDVGYAEDVFSSNDGGVHLNLITCDGVWDGVKKSYTKRLVVFTDVLQ